jgi:hypothetical protein
MLTDVGPNVFRVLYRSVSPWEMVDILETREIRGRGGRFSGDHRHGPECHVWFAESIPPIIHSGEDYLRYMQGLTVWEPVHAALDWLRDRDRAQAGPARHNARELREKLGDAYRKALYALSRQADESAEKLPVTSYIIALYDMPGGAMYTDRDSLQSDAVEVCFPLSAAGELFDHIAGVDLIRRLPQGFKVVEHVTGEQLDQLKVRLPRVRQTTINTVLNTLERMQPKLHALRKYR